MSYLIHHFLENSADQRPDAEAVVHGEIRLSYIEVEKKANAVSNWLLSIGLSRGQRVAMLLRNSVDYIFWYYGILKAGGVAVPLNTGLIMDELSAMLIDCCPEVLISEKNFSSQIVSIMEGGFVNCRYVVMIDNDGGKGHIARAVGVSDIYSNFSESRPSVTIIDQDLSSIIYTSGSTGKPKGVVLTHLNVVTNTKSILAYMKLTENDRCMVILPFYYVYGKSLLNTHFASGGTIIIDNRYAFPNAVLKKMIEEKVTGFAGVPSTYTTMMNQSSVHKMRFPCLRLITQAGGHLASKTKRQLIETFSESKIVIMYGATEASARLAYVAPDALPERIDSIGKPIPNVEIKVLLENGQEAGAGEEGEIVARGSSIMSGYWNAPEETQKILRDQWYYTGDLGYVDKDGFFYVTGRKRDMIKVGIYKISAKEIEDALLQFPEVVAVSVGSVPDDAAGEAIKAVVVLSSGKGVDPDTILKHCSAVLPKYKVPKYVELRDSLPKNEVGKILKQQLFPRLFDE